MTEIEKLYRNAGVGYLMYVVDTFPPIEYPQIDFNEKKQLELIKWLIQKNFSDEYIIRSNFEKTYFFCSYIYDDFCETGPFIKFEEALANVFNYNWQDLTEEERKQVKGILE